ncbi:MAG: hypothetical protein E8D47_04635 [Nitrospira sp.]|nr:MAG: hypothetical protein E8D47_04635 [Nitrospira sp.]
MERGRSGNTWTQQAYLKASNTGGGDLFGWSLALSGDTLAVSANGEDSAGTGVNAPLQGDNNAPNSGAVYLFTRASGVWTQQSYVKASNADLDDQFGSSIALYGDTLVVGTPNEDSWGVGVNVAVQGDNSAANSGAAYVFQRNSGVWAQEAYLKASNTGTDDQFGTSVAIAGDTVVVGAAQEDGNGTGVNPNTQGDNGATDSGAVYVFTRSGSTWTQQAYLKPSNTGAGDRFGDSITLAGDTLAVGAPFEDSIGVGISPSAESDNSAANSGAVYVFGRTSGAWRQDAYLKASNTGSGDMFGSAISLAGDSLAVGAPEEDGAGTGINPGITSEADNSAANSGGVYVFR